MTNPVWTNTETVLGLSRQSIFFRRNLNATGAVNYNIINGTLPSGVTLNPATGVLSGTPDITDPTPNTPVFVFSFTVRASDTNGNTSDKLFKLPVLYYELYVPTNLDQSRVKFFNNYFQYRVSQGYVDSDSNIYWRIPYGELPAGIIMYQNGTIEGIPGNEALPMVRQTFLKADAPNNIPELSQAAWDEWFATFLYTNDHEKDYQFVMALSDGIGATQYSFTVRVLYTKPPTDRNSWFYKNRDYINYNPNMYYVFIAVSDLDVIEWKTDANIEAVNNGSISDKSIEATVNTEKILRYSLKPNFNNRLPDGVAFNENGLITGKISFRCHLDDPVNIPPNDDYQFTVRATTDDGFTYVERTFNWHIIRFHDEPYNNIWIRSFPTSDERKGLDRILNSRVLFPLRLLYRNTDPWFGKTRELRFLFAPGIRNVPLSQYMSALESNHYQKELLFGSVKTAVCLDSQLQIKYEVVYIPVVDNLSRIDAITGKYVGLPDVIDLRTQIKNYYWDKDGQAKYIFKPNGLVNMRSQLAKTIGYYNEGILPGWMTSLQPIPDRLGQFNAPLGFVSGVVLAYTIPGGSSLIAFRLQQLGINFNNFRFEFDRYELEQSIETSDGFPAPVGTSFDDEGTIFDSDNTRFNDNLEFVGSGPFANNKYLKFPKTGAFSNYDK